MSYLDLLNNDLIIVISEHLKIYDILSLLEAKGDSPLIPLLKTRLSPHINKCGDCKVFDFLDNYPDCHLCRAVLCNECFSDNMVKCSQCRNLCHKTCITNCDECSTVL
jgi:hypothetical protein